MSKVSKEVLQTLTTSVGSRDELVADYRKVFDADFRNQVIADGIESGQKGNHVGSYKSPITRRIGAIQNALNDIDDVNWVQSESEQDLSQGRVYYWDAANETDPFGNQNVKVTSVQTDAELVESLTRIHAKFLTTPKFATGPRTRMDKDMSAIVKDLQSRRVEGVTDPRNGRLVYVAPVESADSADENADGNDA